MYYRGTRGGMITVLVAGVTLLTAGCASSGFPHQPTPAAQSRFTLVRVQNNNWQDVRVFLVREAGGSHVRLGTVSSFSSAVLRIREPVDGNAMRLRLEPIGSRAAYVTNGVIAGRGSELSLVVHNSLSLSTLDVRSRE